MELTDSHATPKIHPASREMLPDDPLELQGFEMAGDARLMLQLLVEEYARMGFDARQITDLALDANYQAFHGLRRAFGDDALRSRIAEIVSRCGVVRVTARETEPISERLIPLELPT
ncbi:MAG: hypothetical protein IT424_00155 [Pirellulales bacterium]|nr:hypothetical protein [Pirellulales bacterium]